MNILFISANQYGWGGSELLWSEVAFRMHEQGHQVSCLVWENLSDSFFTRCREVGLPVRTYRNYRSLPSRMLARFGLKKMDIEPVKDRHPDLVVISQDAYDGIDFVEKCIGQGLPTVSILQAVREYNWPIDSISLRIFKSYQQLKKIYFVSEHNQKLLFHQTGYQFQNAELIANPSTLPTDWSAPRLDNAPFCLASVGRLAPIDKGQDLIIEAMSREFWRDKPLSISFFGKGGSEQSLSRLIHHYGLENKIILRGQVENPSQIWATHQGLIFPSRSEGFSLSLIEACFASRFAIASTVGDAEKLIQHGRNGFLIPSLTAESVHLALVEAWESRNRWTELGLAARESVMKRIPRDPIEELLHRLLELGKQPNAKAA